MDKTKEQQLSEWAKTAYEALRGAEVLAKEWARAYAGAYGEEGDTPSIVAAIKLENNDNYMAILDAVAVAREMAGETGNPQTRIL